MLIDLHVHSHHSPGCALAPRDLVRSAREAGLDGLVLTDTNTLDGLEELREAGRAEGVLALCGAELVTDHGHYLCYFPAPEKVPALPQLLGPMPWAAREAIDAVRAQGGVVVAAHPYDKSIDRPSGDFIFSLEGISAIEALCARRKGPASDLAVEAADHMNLPCVGGSGAKGSLDEVGAAATLFREPVANEADLVRQLAGGHVFCVAVGATPAGPDRHGRREERGRESHGGRREGGRDGGHDARRGGGGRRPRW